MAITKEIFGRMGDRDSTLYTLAGDLIRAVVTDFGGVVVCLETPDAQGRMADVTLGYDRLKEYELDRNYFGAIVGRCANRIAGGKFEIDDLTYNLARNENTKHHLHGGVKGFSAKPWDSRIEEQNGLERLVLELTSPHQDEGYPGELHVKATYSLAEPGGLLLEMSARTDRPTIVNLTNHAYFNLSGHDSGTIHDHEVMIRADSVTETDDDLIPIGRIAPVQGGSLDFRSFRRMADGLAQNGGTLDHNFVLNADSTDEMPAATLYDPASGRVMELFTDAPGLQFYSGHYIPVGTPGKSGALYGPYSGLCLEPQVHPNAVNIPGFPSVILRPGDVYRHTILYKFGVRLRK